MLEEPVIGVGDIDRLEVYRQMGYPDGALVMEPISDVCEQQIRRIAEIATPWCMRCEIAVQRVERDAVILAGNRMLVSRLLAKLMRRAVAVDLLMVTLGERVSQEIRTLTVNGDMLEALALDAAANAATNTLIQRLQETSCAAATARGLGTTIRYGPGYTGWPLGDIQVLFSCLEARDMPVRLNAQGMLAPEKTLLCLVGRVSGGRLAKHVAPCKMCDLQKCPMRRKPYGSRKREV